LRQRCDDEYDIACRIHTCRGCNADARDEVDIDYLICDLREHAEGDRRSDRQYVSRY
jgi:hypothetical protein